MGPVLEPEFAPGLRSVQGGVPLSKLQNLNYLATYKLTAVVFFKVFHYFDLEITYHCPYTTHFQVLQTVGLSGQHVQSLVE